MKRVHIRLDVTESERNLIRRAAALGGFRSMAEMARTIITQEAMSIETQEQKKIQFNIPCDESSAPC